MRAHLNLFRYCVSYHWRLCIGCHWSTVCVSYRANSELHVRRPCNILHQWLETNPAAEEDDLTAKQKEIESIANPIMARSARSRDTCWPIDNTDFQLTCLLPQSYRLRCRMGPHVNAVLICTKL